MGKTLQYVNIIFMLISFISSLKAFRLDMPLIFKQFSYFLLFVFLCESFGIAWPKGISDIFHLGKPNQWFYNFFHVLMYSFYFYFFHRILVSAKLKKLVVVFFIVYIAVVIVNFSRNGVYQFNLTNFQVAAFLMFFLSITYYYQLLSAREFVSLKNDIPFWISTGLMMYHLGSALELSLITYFSKAAAEKIHMLVMLASLAMYLTYTIGYLCHKKPLSGRQ